MDDLKKTISDIKNQTEALKKSAGKLGIEVDYNIENIDDNISAQKCVDDFQDGISDALDELKKLAEIVAESKFKLKTFNDNA